MSKNEILYIKVVNLIADYENKDKAVEETMKKLRRQKVTLTNAIHILYNVKEKLKERL